MDARSGQPYGHSAQIGRSTAKSSLYPSPSYLSHRRTHQHFPNSILENINMAVNNQMALHTTPGCFAPAQGNATQSGTTLQQDCGTSEGCTVKENTPNSYQAGFAQVGGGVWAVQFDASG